MKTFGIIEKLGGRRAVTELVSEGLRPITTDTVRMWCARGRIPGDALRALLHEAERRGIEVGATDLDPAVVERKAA